MADETQEHDGEHKRTKGIGQYVFLLGYIVAILAGALFMRAVIPDIDLKTELAAIEQQDTERVDLGELPPVLRPLGEAVPVLPISGSVYVPLYNELYVGGQRSSKNLSATLLLRNTSVDQELVVTSATYFNAEGKPVAELFEGPHVLPPTATATFYVDRSGMPDASISSIVVDWGAEMPIAEPTIEAVVLGSYGAKSISFVSRGTRRP